MHMTIGIVGVGKMGAAMWRRLKDQGQNAIVYDIRREAMDPLEKLGAPVASSPKDAAARSSVLILSLPKSTDVEKAVLGESGVIHGARPGLTVIDTTSGDPPVTRRVAAELAKKRVRMIDAAVSGGVGGAEKGTLKVMAGGERAAYDACKPLLDLLGKRVYYCGPSGAGHTMKTVHNLAAQAKMVVEAETLILGAKAGLDPRLCAEVMDMGAMARVIGGKDGRPEFGATVWTNAKDFDVAIGLAQAVGVPVPVGTAAQQEMRTILGAVGPEADLVEFVRVMEDWAGVQLPGYPKAKRRLK